MDLAGVFGVFTAIDMFLFFFFWEMMLVPMYFLIALWGHKGIRRQDAYYRGDQVLHLYRASGLVMLIAIFGFGVGALQRHRGAEL